ncbi:hypothetical protein ABW21_db0205444 [Orbilia brochopaga]|nr:hypothetical protein ABW21_db0205444 [Drechslerella brochopaga]
MGVKVFRGLSSTLRSTDIGEDINAARFFGLMEGRPADMSPSKYAKVKTGKDWSGVLKESHVNVGLASESHARGLAFITNDGVFQKHFGSALNKYGVTTYLITQADSNLLESLPATATTISSSSSFNYCVSSFVIFLSWFSFRELFQDPPYRFGVPLG